MNRERRCVHMCYATASKRAAAHTARNTKTQHAHLGDRAWTSVSLRLSDTHRGVSPQTVAPPQPPASGASHRHRVRPRARRPARAPRQILRRGSPSLPTRHRMAKEPRLPRAHTLKPAPWRPPHVTCPLPCITTSFASAPQSRRARSAPSISLARARRPPAAGGPRAPPLGPRLHHPVPLSSLAPSSSVDSPASARDARGRASGARRRSTSCRAPTHHHIVLWAGLRRAGPRLIDHPRGGAPTAPAHI